MAEVYEIQRSEFERLARLNCSPMRAHRFEVEKPEYVLVSTWAEFGRMNGHLCIRTRYTNEKAFELSEVLEECSYDNVMYGGDTIVDEYEIWHVVDDVEEQPDEMESLISDEAAPVYGTRSYYTIDSGEGLPRIGYFEVVPLKGSSMIWRGFDADWYDSLVGWCVDSRTGYEIKCRIARMQNGQLYLVTDKGGEPVARLRKVGR